MAYQQIQRIGKGNVPKLTLYKFTSDATYIRPYGYFTQTVINEQIDKEGWGTNIVEIVTDITAGSQYDLFTLGKDHKLTLYIPSSNQSYSFQHTSKYPTWLCEMFNTTLQIRTIETNTLIKEYVHCPLYRTATSDTGITRKGEMYLNACVDEETHSIFIKSIHLPLSNVGLDSYGFENVEVSAKLGGAGAIYDYVNGKYDLPDDDPWSNAGYADIGGGNGTFNFSSDIIGLPSLPTVDATSSGFLQLFSGPLSNIVDLSKYMWSDNFFDNIVKITDNPLDIVMGLYMYPFTVPASRTKQIRAGNVITPVRMGVPDSQIFEFDCGEFPVPNFYGAYLDYEPFTKCEIFLPYCGTFSLSMDDIAGTTINVRYRVDLLTGVCCAYVIVDDTVKYNFSGACAINIPISSRSFENLYNSIMGVVGSAFGGGSFGLPSIGSVAGAVTSGKNQIQHGGNASGNAGYLGVQRPYLIFNVPNVAIPKGLNKYTGYPIYSTFKLSELTGYTEVEKIHLENMGKATHEEVDRILTLLEKGVIL